MRDLLRWASFIAEFHDPCLGAEILYVSRLPNAALQNAARVRYGRVFDVDAVLPSAKIFQHNERGVCFGHPKYSLGIGPNVAVNSDRLVLLPSQNRLLQQLCVCANLNWLALLNGPRLSGKGSVVEVLATLAGRDLKRMRLNKETDASELLGTYEQILDYGVLHECASKFVQILESGNVGGLSASDISTLLNDLNSPKGENVQFLRLKISQVAALSTGEAQTELEALAHQLEAVCLRFEWRNSVFVEVSIAARLPFWIVSTAVSKVVANSSFPSKLMAVTSRSRPTHTVLRFAETVVAGTGAPTSPNCIAAICVADPRLRSALCLLFRIWMARTRLVLEVSLEQAQIIPQSGVYTNTMYNNYGGSNAGGYASYGSYPGTGANATFPNVAGSTGANFGNSFFQAANRGYTQAPSVTRDYGYGAPGDYSQSYKVQSAENPYGLGERRMPNNAPVGFTSAGQLASTPAALGGAYGAMNSTSSAVSGTHYEGYDAAVYAAASSYLTQKVGGGMSWINKPVARPSIHPDAHFATKNRRNFMKDPPKSIYCETCKISCAGPVAHREHLAGKAHKKKLALINGENKQSLPRAKTTYRCDVCEIMCTGKDTYDAHVRGSKHQKTLQTLKRLGKPIPTTDPTIIPPKDSSSPNAVPIGTVDIPAVPTTLPAAPKKIVGVTGSKFVGGSTLNSTSNGESTVMTESANDDGDVEVKPVGEEYVDAKYGPGGRLIEYHCRLCECSFTDPNAKAIHTKGRRHRTSYKQKVDPTLKVEVKGSVARSHAKRSQKFGDEGANGAPAANFFNNSGPNHQWVDVDNSVFAANNQSVDDTHIIAKYNEIQISMEEYESVNRLVDIIEAALKVVSDKLVDTDFDKPSTAEIEPKAEPASEDDAPEPGEAKDRVLKGLMRVGLLANNLLMKEDTTVDVVVLCVKIPTTYGLDKIVALLPECIDKTHADKLTITPDADKASIAVKIEGFTHTVNVSLTSGLVRPFEGRPDNTEGLPESVLPLAPMLNALAELRHANWYNNRAAPLAAMSMTMVILRDIRQRVITWEPLTTFMLSMLVQNVLESFGYPMTPGDALRRVFEAISSGLLLSKRPILYDPCEKDKVDVFGALTFQQREDITSSAQHALRLIIFEQIDKVLDMDRIEETAEGADAADEASRKRFHADDLNGSEMVDVKKSKIEPTTIA
uniref:DZF domain-containing protein n=1 Tax=Panagrellus redivivus TaxID=6233 RepID=A0A7E4W9L6_PANRE